ncbi:hypothetical protein DFH07DRAFT_936690 [Mycena maculata]|uniref:Glycoside hydrolase family 76 protein n=1 Tax=Mycena maculata TaxID=230809 RepID=A0AAD7K5T9_9AGAR|nr:hypothetical protein DFH07DRAFT_936690 [Mycena maculata]
MLFFLLLMVGHFFPGTLVAAQVPSPSWRKSDITTSAVDRVNLTGTALDVAIGRLNGEGLFNGEATGIAGYLYSQMAEFDIITNQTKYETTLEQYLDLIQQTHANFSDPTYTFGHAAARAYTAYKNPIFLQYAVQSWWFGRAYTLSDSDVSAGKIATKNFTISGVCPTFNETPETMAGGTFHILSCFLPPERLSALLAEATSDPLYLQAATQSADFIRAHLYSPRNIVQEYILAGYNESCQVIPTTFPSITPAASGLMIEGLAIIYSITNNASTQSLLNDLLVAVIPDIDWQGDNGIVAYQISSTATMGDMNLLQGLAAVYTRNSTTTALLQYVGAYIAVQFNAVSDLATTSGTNIYAGSWTGPPSTDFLGFNQTAALAALLGAISLPMTSVARGPPSRRAAILGGSVGGGVVVLTVVAILGFLRLRRIGCSHRVCCRIPGRDGCVLGHRGSRTYSSSRCGAGGGCFRGPTHPGGQWNTPCADAVTPAEIHTPSAPLGVSLESGMNPSTETTPATSAPTTGLDPQTPRAEDTSMATGDPSGSMMAVSDPADLSRNAGAFFPRAQHFVVAGGHFTTNIINLPSPTSPEFAERGSATFGARFTSERTGNASHCPNILRRGSEGGSGSPAPGPIPVALPSILLTSTSKIGGNVAALSALPITDINCPSPPAELGRSGLKDSRGITKKIQLL